MTTECAAITGAEVSGNNPQGTEVHDTFLLSTQIALDAMAVLSGISIEPIPADPNGQVTIGGIRQDVPANSAALKLLLPKKLSVRDFKLRLFDTEQRLGAEASPLGEAYRNALASEVVPPQTPLPPLMRRAA